MSDSREERRRKYWLTGVWAAYLLVPWYFGILHLDRWECTVLWSIRWLLVCVGYITIGIAIYVVTGTSPADEAGRVRRGTSALAALSAVFALQATVNAYGCPY